jgi:NAD(P)H-hydrate epimerase
MNAGTLRRRDGMNAVSDTILLTVAEMARADAYAIDHGVPGLELMETAGGAVAAAIRERWPPRPVAVLCGPGNNGGDGFVVARLLDAAGWPVRLALLGAVDQLPDDARHNAERWAGTIEPLSPAVLDGAELIIDALFGAGLARPLEGAALDVVERLATLGTAPCIAVDVPSGVDGDSGAVLGAAPHCALTVTFFRRKPGHLLLPGRLHCGEVVVADIGIPAAALDDIAPRISANAPALWLDAMRWPRLDDHKYRRGHGVVRGGAEMTGAARLAARSAMRAGAGIVTVACPEVAFPIYAAALTGILVKPMRDRGGFAAVLDDPRVAAIRVGPGNGVDLATRADVRAALATGKPCVLDADALSVFEDAPGELFEGIRGPVVLTPHDGEYARLFVHRGDRLSRAVAAAAEAGAVVVLKGADTVVAAADGRAAIANNAPAALATAGAGDVLAGLVLGLLAQGMAAFDAAAAAVWLHGAAAAEIGIGVVADDLPDCVPAVLNRLAPALGGASQ